MRPPSLQTVHACLGKGRVGPGRNWTFVVLGGMDDAGRCQAFVACPQVRRRGRHSFRLSLPGKGFWSHFGSQNVQTSCVFSIRTMFGFRSGYLFREPLREPPADPPGTRWDTLGPPGPPRIRRTPPRVDSTKSGCPVSGFSMRFAALCPLTWLTCKEH